jgi:hypothetical protein
MSYEEEDTCMSHEEQEQRPFDRVELDDFCQKRPTTVSKETYYSVKRDLLQRPFDRVELDDFVHMRRLGKFYCC